VHITEGVLDIKIVAGGFALTAGLTAWALKKTKQKDIPRLAVLGAVFFVSSLIHFKVGVTSVHLTLIGLMGLILGAPAPLAILSGLFFQAVMFQHGGLSTLGINTVIFALPALGVSAAFHPLLKRWPEHRTLLGICAALLSAAAVLLGAALVFGVLRLSGQTLTGIAYLFSAAHAVLALVEGLITFLVVLQILRVKPQMLSGYAV